MRRDTRMDVIQNGATLLNFDKSNANFQSREWRNGTIWV